MEKKLAKLTYDKFSKVDGNQHIAGQFAIESILKIVDTFNINSILEIGLGIGSISDAVLNYAKQKNKTITYVGTEANEFCLNALKVNVVNYNNIIVYDDIKAIDKEQKFDLIVIDGADSSMEILKNLAHNNTIVFIEGGRFDQVQKLKETFPKLLHSGVISDYKNSKDGPFSADRWSCGGSVFILYPNLNSRLFWFYHRLRTAYIWRKRKLNK